MQEEVAKNDPVLEMPPPLTHVGYTGPPVAGAKLRMLLPPLDPAASSAQQRRLHEAAARMRDPAYSMRQFHEDMHACFEELKLYLATEDSLVGGETFSESSVTTSGMLTSDEYKRTVTSTQSAQNPPRAAPHRPNNHA